MRLFLLNHQLVMPLSLVSRSAGEWFDEIASQLKEDVAEFESQKGSAASTEHAHGLLGISLEVKRDGEFYEPFSLKLSSRFSTIDVVANDPPGWLVIQVHKESPIFDGVLHRGAIEIIQVPPKMMKKYKTTLVNCEWLGVDPSTPLEIADLLWKQLLDPQVDLQFRQAEKEARRLR